MADELESPFVFVPNGAPVPDAVRGPGWVRIPATFVPRDRVGRDWPKDRLGRQVAPLSEVAPGVRAPGEGGPDGGDPIAAYRAAEAAFRDPAGAAGLGRKPSIDAGWGVTGALTSPADPPLTSQHPGPGNGMAEGGVSDATGVEVVLPNGSKEPDENSPTGWLMSPVADLSKVAAAGWAAGILLNAGVQGDDSVASTVFFVRLGLDLGQGGRFDYQREGNHLTGFIQHRQFKHVSNFNVGLYCQKSGLSLNETLELVGTYAGYF